MWACDCEHCVFVLCRLEASTAQLHMSRRSGTCTIYRLQSIIESDSEHWKNIVIEINVQDGTQTLWSTDLEVISCWLRSPHSIDSRPCGSRQIAWLMAMCWKRMPVLCIRAKMDMQTANSRLFGRGSLAHSKQGISGVRCLSWTWLCVVCLPLWQM